jgi:putative CocE/NonD family hydrolase
MPDSGVRIRWGVKIALRDGVRLDATLYLPEIQDQPAPALFTLTPYIAQSYHDQGLRFASYGYPFLTIDARGRGNSQGEFFPNLHEGFDGYDIVEWLAQQPYCDGKVAMWGGSYAGHAQWNTARRFPPHLATIVPVASPYLGLDFPFRNNIGSNYVMQWLTLVSGSTSQEKIFADQSYWNRQFRCWFERGAAYRELDQCVGNPSPIFQKWVAHPAQDDFWEAFNPTPEEYQQIALPILTITGIYDGDQPGALKHYREHLKHASPEARKRHYLIIGPWDHAGTRAPKAGFAGIKVGPESLLDLAELHRQWYAWTLKGGARPQFLRDNVCYYVMGADCWRYAQTLESVTHRKLPLLLVSDGNPTDILHSGALVLQTTTSPGGPDSYVYDPRDVSLAALESQVDPEDRSEQRLLYASRGSQLFYHSEPLAEDTEVSGFFALTAWLAIDQADTDFRAVIYEVGMDGSSVVLSFDTMRARYRESPRFERLIATREPLRYEFCNFTFVARRIRRGHRLRLVIGPINSIFSQKNHNTGGVVSEESVGVSRPVTVRLFHDAKHPSVLHVPIGSRDV